MPEDAVTQVRALLFTDLVGSTELRVALGEEGADAFRRTHDELLARVVAENNGQVVKGLGDGIMATFLSAVDATTAAIAIQVAIDLYVRRTPEHAFSVRVGLSVGEVTLDAGDVFGVPVVEAARLCAAATGAEILAADLVRAVSRGRGGTTFEPMGDLELKGLPEPVSVCRILWTPALDTATDDDGSRAPFPGPLTIGGVAYVGRPEVRARLEQIWRQTASGGTYVVLVSGEPGIGKTRTASEISRIAWVDGALVLYGRCDEDLAMPYQPFAEALDSYVTNAESGAHTLGRLPGELARLAPQLGRHVDDLPPPVQSDPRSEEHQLFESVASWITQLGKQVPVVLVLDDLQWATKPTLLLLLHVLRAAVAAGDRLSLLVCATYRDSDIDRGHPLSTVMGDLRRIPSCERIGIEGLNDKEVGEFIALAAGQTLDGDVVRLAETVRSETEGNPFFVAEVLRHLVESGAVQRKDDRWVIADGQAYSVPEGVRDVVGRRLSRLSGDANELLSYASVIGREFDVDVLAILSPATEDQILDALDEAVRARLIDEVGADRFRFSSAVIRATLYEELSATRKRRLHRRVAEAIEKLRPDDVVALAHHFIEAGPDGGDMSSAVRYALAAGEKALSARALADAEAQFKQAIEIMDEPESTEHVAALCGLGISQRDQGVQSYRDTLLAAGRFALAAGSDELLIRAVLANSRGIASVVGVVDDDRLGLIGSALDVVEEGSPDHARLLALLATEVTFAGDYERRLALSDEAEALARRIGDPELLANVLVRTGFAAQAVDRSERILARATEGVELSDRTRDPTLRFLARVWWSSALLTVGDYSAFLRATEEMLALSEQVPPTQRWIARAFQIRVLLAEGRLDEAHARNDECLQLGLELGEPDAFMWWGALIAAEGRERGLITTTPEQLEEFATTYQGVRTWRVTHALALVSRGELMEARTVIERYHLDPVDLARDPFPLWGPYQFAEYAYAVRDASIAERTLTVLVAHRDAWSHYHLYTAGPIETAIGLCCLAAGRIEQAVEAFRASVAKLHDLGTVTLLTRAIVGLAEALIDRDAQGDKAEASLLLDDRRSVAMRIGATGVIERIDSLASRL